MIHQELTGQTVGGIESGNKIAFSCEPIGHRNYQFGEPKGLQHKEGWTDDVCG
jgi:hypothetical protein